MEMKLKKWDFTLNVFAFLLILQRINGFTNTVPKCTTPNNEAGYCLPQSSCDNYLKYLKTKFEGDELSTFIDQSYCNKNDIENIHICCDENYVTPNSFYKADEYTSSLDPNGFEILSSLEDCGNTTNFRIAFGTNATLGEFPWIALIEYDNPALSCEGSLITNRYILTAAHCLKREEKITGVILGEYNLDTDPDCGLKKRQKYCLPPRERFGIDNIIPHPHYSKYDISFDIGLIKLSTAVIFKANIFPICLPITPFSLQKQDDYIIAGFGTTETGETARIMQVAFVKYNERNVCAQRFHRERITSHHMCIGGNGRISACMGDSGGPLFNAAIYLPLKSRYIQYGIVSHGGSNCSAFDKAPAIYTNVTEFMQWITSNIIDVTDNTEIKLRSAQPKIPSKANFRLISVRLIYLLILTLIFLN